MRNILAFGIWVLVGLFGAGVHAVPVVKLGLYDGKTLQPTSLDLALDQVQPGTVVFLGEMHGLSPIRDQHVNVLNELRARHSTVISVGMEFFNYDQQEILNGFSAGEISESDFLKQVNWQGFSFDFYREQVLFPQFARGEMIVGLNISRTITSQIARGGLESLTPEQQSSMPPNFSVGRSSYRERFFAAMGMHPTPQLENYFVAQSTWDDTMAWRAVEFVKAHPEHIFVIIVGEFHVQFGGGFPDRFRARLVEENLNPAIISFSQIYTEGMTNDDIWSELQPTLTEGPRADYIWLSEPAIQPPAFQLQFQ
jgi:uncharacterized iron-regulated protein